LKDGRLEILLRLEWENSIPGIFPYAKSKCDFDLASFSIGDPVENGGASLHRRVPGISQGTRYTGYNKIRTPP